MSGGAETHCDWIVFRLKPMVLAQFNDEGKIRIIVSDLTTINGFQTVEADSHGTWLCYCGGRLHGTRGYVVRKVTSDFTATDLGNTIGSQIVELKPQDAL
ncbi:hypothetical protein CEXT_718771 [Caerostris extrusa]|uniref:Uncharacterized protein n=1 Tax=Caerostris extrusa TaxID=172846 RepID=A0AAV4PRA1_CAEEX|nr:hypothetical protein CEXT_718771 [Caerostris extrusa]